MKIKIAIVLLNGLITSACQSTGNTDTKIDLKSEIESYYRCIYGNAAKFAQQPESAIDLGKVAHAACSSERFALEQAMRRKEGKAYTDRYMELDRTQQPALLAAEILKARRS